MTISYVLMLGNSKKLTVFGNIEKGFKPDTATLLLQHFLNIHFEKINSLYSCLCLHRVVIKWGMAEYFVFAYTVRPFLQKIWRHLLIFFILAIDSKR